MIIFCLCMLTVYSGYIPMVHESKPHGRIIWDCAWAPEGDIFATASRDKTVCPRAVLP